MKDMSHILMKIHILSQISYHEKGFELLQEDLSSLLIKKESRQLPSGNTVYPTKRLKQVIPGRNVLIFVYIVVIFGFITYRLVTWDIRSYCNKKPNRVNTQYLF